MSLAAAIAGLTFVMVVTLIAGIWWSVTTSRRVQDRLGVRFRVTPEADTGTLRVISQDAESQWRALVSPLVTLVQQAGYDTGRVTRVLLFMGTFALVGGGAVWLRTEWLTGGVLGALIAGSLPVLYLVRKRYQRLQRFEKQFPDALDMMTRSIRAGYALSGAIQVVGQEMPDPVGQEFRRVFEENRLGMDPGDSVALSEIAEFAVTCDNVSCAVSDGTAPTGKFNAGRAYADVVTQVEFGPRIPGSDGHAAFILWAADEFTAAGWSVDIPQMAYHNQPATNIIARRGDPEPGRDWILLGAHYDTRARADRDPDPENRTLPVPGANDGASGVAVLLELARTLPETEAVVWIVLFDAEDGGDIDGGEWIVGSQAFAEALPGMAAGRLPDQVIVVDMIGDAELNIHYELNSSQEISMAIWDIARSLGYGEQFLPFPKYRMIDDHTPFLRLGIPTALLIDFDYPYWHTIEDTPDKISAESLSAVGETLIAFLTIR